ncbi:GntP family permease [Bacteroides ovatus]|uniref:GntP family permease n=1 Tax=Bacteroides ovatus TaxID=28116 RepID=UPI00314509CC
MNSALAATIGLILSIILIIKKVSPVYSLILGALIGGLLAGWGLENTVTEMISGIKDITPAIIRILAAGVLTGMLVKTGAASSISHAIIKKLGAKQIYLALALSAMLLTAIGVFIDVAVITIAPIALIAGSQLKLSRAKLLVAMIGGGKCGNIISPNPNSIIAAENFGAPLPSVMAANILPAIIGLLFTIYIIVPLLPKGNILQPTEQVEENKLLPSLWSSVIAPIVTILLLTLRPLFGIIIDPLVALSAGGIVGIIATHNWNKTNECLSYGLGKMSTIAILLIGTGALAGVIKASTIKDILIELLAGWSNGGTIMAPLSGALMCAATASTTAGATIASASFAQSILGAGVAAIWGAAMINAGSTVLDHLPHGSFFHATGGAVGMDVKERLKLIAYETAIGLVLAISSVLLYVCIS